jgi:hypothetical protein
MSTLFLAIKSLLLKLHFVCSFVIYFAALLKRNCTVLRVFETVGAARAVSRLTSLPLHPRAVMEQDI